MGLLKELKRISLWRRGKAKDEPATSAEAAVPCDATPERSAQVKEEVAASVEDTDGDDALVASVDPAADRSPSFPSSPAKAKNCTAASPKSNAGSNINSVGERGSPSRSRQFGNAAVPAESPKGATSFDVALEEVYAGIAEAYGQMIATSLRSSKWDKRSEALKAMTSVLKGMDLRGMAPPGSTGVLGKGLKPEQRQRCWRLSCQLLGHALCDKVMPVRLAAHQLFLDTFSNSRGVIQEEEVKLAASVLVEHLIERLGDSNMRLHESARRCVLFTAEHPNVLGLHGVLSRLRARLEGTKSKGGERVKVFFGVLDTVNFMVQHFPGHGVAWEADTHEQADEEAQIVAGQRDTWSQDDVAPFVTLGMDDALGPRVRSSAVSLAVAIYQTYGIEAMTPVLDSLRPAIQALLKQKFQEAEEEGQEGGDSSDCGAPDRSGRSRRPATGGLVVSGNAAKPPPGYTLPPINATPALPEIDFDEEDRLMDDILEEAGMVFSGTGLSMAYGMGSGFQETLPSSLGLSFMDEEHRILEEELRELGMDLEELDEQQALLSSLQSDDRGQKPVSVEVC